MRFTIAAFGRFSGSIYSSWLSSAVMSPLLSGDLESLSESLSTELVGVRVSCLKVAYNPTTDIEAVKFLVGSGVTSIRLFT